MIVEALAEARIELESLRTREAELEAQIAQAEATLGTGSANASAVTLHKAMALVLEEEADQGLTARELADAVTERGLYRQRDGGPVEHATTRHVQDDRARLEPGGRVAPDQPARPARQRDVDGHDVGTR